MPLSDEDISQIPKLLKILREGGLRRAEVFGMVFEFEGAQKVYDPPETQRSPLSKQEYEAQALADYEATLFASAPVIRMGG